MIQRILWWLAFAVFSCACAAGVSMIAIDGFHRGTPFGIFILCIPASMSGFYMGVSLFAFPQSDVSTFRRVISMFALCIACIPVLLFGLVVLMALAG